MDNNGYADILERINSLFADEGFSAGVRRELIDCAQLVGAVKASIYLFATPWKLNKFVEWMENPMVAEDVYLKNLYLKWFPWLESVLDRGLSWSLLKKEDLTLQQDRDLSFFETAGFDQLLVYPFTVDGERFGLVWMEMGKTSAIEEETFKAVEDHVRILEKAFKFRWMEKQIRNLREELRETALVKNSFLSNISHEIRTPLNAIIGFSHLLNTELHDEKHLRYADAIQSSGHSLLKLVNDILSLSRLESRGEKINLKRTELAEILNEMEQIFLVKFRDKNIQFIKEIDENLPSRLMLDEEKIRQILINLIGNAIKFTQQGYVKVSIGLMMGSFRGGKLDLIMAIEDTGIGIDEGDLKRIFEPFVQQSDSNLKRFEGAGLGLTLCKKLTDLLGGQIQVKSTQGTGSIFSLFFPSVVVPEAKTSEQNIESVEDIDGLVFQKKTVLIADDHVNNLTLLEVLLKRAGLDVISAANGKEAVLLAERLKPDLILMDLKMPVMDGIEAAAMIRSKPDVRGIPIIVLTAYPDIIHDTNRGVFNGFLIKPVSIPLVIKELAKYFEYSYIREDKTQGTRPDNGEGKLLTVDPAVMDKLKQEVLPLLEGTRSALVMKDVFRIAEMVKSLAHECDNSELLTVSEKLLRYVHNFDVDKMDKLLGEFYHCLKEK